MMQTISKWTLTLAAFAFLLAGCASHPAVSESTGQTATCYVCRYNNDLACVNVKVKESTPHAEYHGTNYCFCSEECRRVFLKNPQKYLPKVARNDHAAESPESGLK